VGRRRNCWGGIERGEAVEKEAGGAGKGG